MADTPGRILSSLSNADGKTPKVGGCVGVFFQLFDWNRRLSGKHLFSTKSLPAERPQSNKFNDEKLPMAKLLLIADENRGAFSRTSDSETPSEIDGYSERSSLENASKKPGVVARLMGLESFPEPPPSDPEFETQELFFKQQRRMHHYQELQMLEDLLHSDGLRTHDSVRPSDKLRTHVLPPDNVRTHIPPPTQCTAVQPPVNPSKSTGSVIHSQPLENLRTKPRSELRRPITSTKMPKNTKKNQDPMDKFASPKKSATSLLPPSKSTNKMIPAVKTLSSRKTSLILGAATKILDQPNRARPLLRDNTEPKQSSTEARQCRKPNVQKSPPEVRNINRVTKTGVAAKNTKQGKVADNEDQYSEDSQASSSKENRLNHNGVRKVSVSTTTPSSGPRLSRSGSVKEEQPPTPPSRGTLFRSKSVREDSREDTQNLPDTETVNSGTTPCSSKEVRLKREKRPRTVQEGPGSSPMHEKARKPPLDTGRTKSSRKAVKQDQQSSKPSSPSSSSILSYDRLFGTKKKSSPEGVKNKGNEEKAKRASKEESKTKLPQKSEKSLMKSLLRRKPLSKAETVSSSKKKVATVDKPKNDRPYERQVRSGGSSPARNNVKETTINFAEREYVSSDVLKERNIRNSDKPIFDLSPEKLHNEKMVHIEHDILADKSLEEILKTILSKSLKTNGASPLGVNKEYPQVEEENLDDDRVLDMEVEESPPDDPSVSRCDDQQLDDLPSKALRFDDEDFEESQVSTTPLQLPLDPSDPSKTPCATAEDTGQPSPVSVLDFSSPFPSEASDEDNKPETILVKPDMTLDTILENYSLSFQEAEEEPTSFEGDEILLYVREVLSGSGLDKLYPDDHVPCTEDVLERLEKQRSIQQESSRFSDAPWCQKLMYGCIGEALNLVLDQYRDGNYRPCVNLVAEVSEYILTWREMTLGLVDDLVEVDMCTAAGKWRGFRNERVEIGIDLERMIFRNMIEDLISEFVGVSTARTALEK